MPLVHHTYGRLNWELPGGGSESGEAPDETARRELHEERGCTSSSITSQGVHYELDADLGAMLHFVFRFHWDDGLKPVASSPEISDVRFWQLDNLPRPISDFTERRIEDATGDEPPRVTVVNGRRWRV